MTIYEQHSHLYDVAFSWDIGDEVEWLISRFGPDTRVVLEPACGSGRMLPAFMDRGVEVVGVDRSAAMIDRAQRRIADRGLPAPRILRADMANFALGQIFDGALCPINSFGYLLERQHARSHLTAVARHLRRGGKYFIQLDLIDFDQPPLLGPGENSWESRQGDLTLRTCWFVRCVDRVSRIGTEVCRMEVLSGPGKGAVIEDEHTVRQWDWLEWAELIDESPFSLHSCFDGNSRERERLPIGRSLQNRHLVWYELVAE